NNLMRVTLQALAAVMGGTQSLHTNGYDEALGLPTAKAATLALRTQQVIAFESGVVDTVDPLAGSYFVESLTDGVEAAAWQYLEKIDAMGGAVAAIEAGFMQDEITQAAYDFTRAVDRGDKVVVGVNRYVDDDHGEPDVFPIDPALQAQQVAKVQRTRAERNQSEVDARLTDVEAAARGTQNVLVPMKEALRARATLGEVSDVLRGVFGVHQQRN
ncbi:MAG: methylmalonyl-CoA mutase family protein, partial [Acidimicrobiales bacterium]